MPTPPKLPEEVEKRFDLIWGLAPPDSLKGKKGVELKEWFAQELSLALQARDEELRGKIEKKIEKWEAAECETWGARSEDFGEGVLEGWNAFRDKLLSLLAPPKT
jgi:hypothetical protein